LFDLTSCNLLPLSCFECPRSSCPPHRFLFPSDCLSGTEEYLLVLCAQLVKYYRKQIYATRQVTLLEATFLSWALSFTWPKSQGHGKYLFRRRQRGKLTAKILAHGQ
jgi:hypothetical protein